MGDVWLFRCQTVITKISDSWAVLFTGEQDESVCKTYITQLRDLRLQIEDCESCTVARIRQPVDKEPLKDCLQKATDQRVR